MDTKDILKNLIEQLNNESLIQFFRSKTRTFTQTGLQVLTDQAEFSDGLQVGEFKTDISELAAYCFKVNKPLSERSGKKAQYDLAKEILKQEQHYAAGIFVFYDDKGDFRFSLVYDIVSTEGKRSWSNFRRFTYFVSKEQTNKTFIRQMETADFSSLDKIKDAFSVEKVNKQFYQEIANWYFWSLKNVKFPDDIENEPNGREISLIRLITRLIFIWFMKVRKLIPEDLFKIDSLTNILNNLDVNNDNYYKAILQNLFFATLNTKPEERRFTSKKRGYKGFSNDFGKHNFYRYENLFKDSEYAIENYFMPIPFLNGGLFECLDYKSKNKEERKYIDGFTEVKSQQSKVPNFLFFSDDTIVDLSKVYGEAKYKNSKVCGIVQTLSHYNFTIDENDPNDADIALDPELLGKVFENLLAVYNPETATTARKSSGSYYTPREIVNYMVDKSLKQYFRTNLEDDNINDKLEHLFSNGEVNNPFNDEQTKKIVKLIDALRIVDPTVGSGAFPMAILNRLVSLLHKLDPDNSLWKQSQIDGIKRSVTDKVLQRELIEQTERKFKEKNPDYGRKLYLIEKCIYGVDIQQIAVEIAKLRFFISLLVDEKIEDNQIEPLPNLDFKLMQGNSLINSFAQIDFNNAKKINDALFDFDEKYKRLIDEFNELKSQYQNESDVHKKQNLRVDIDNKLLEIFEEKIKQNFTQLKAIENKADAIRNEKERKEYLQKEKHKLFNKIGIDLENAEQELIAYTEGRKPKDFFLWDVYFAEVFAEKKGFDIVIGNPPYIQLQKAFNQKIKYADLYKEQKFKTFERTGDIYCLFYEKGIQLLKPNGLLCYITSNKWMRAGYGESLRKFFLQFNPKILIDLGPNVFENATVDTNILLVVKQENKNELLEVTVTEKKKDGIDLTAIVKEKAVTLNKLTQDAWFIGSNAEQRLKEKIERIGKPLKDWDVKIYRGVLTGLNEAFIITTEKRNEILANCQTEDERHRTEAIIKPILRGRDIKRYYYEWAGLWVIVIPAGWTKQKVPSSSLMKEEIAEIEIMKLLPSLMSHLLTFEEKAKKRDDQGDYWWELRRCAYYPEFEKEKVVWASVGETFYSWIDKKYFVLDTNYFTTSLTKWQLGILNSKLIINYINGLDTYVGSIAYRHYKYNFEKIPLPPMTPSNQTIVAQIEALVDKIIAAKKENPQTDTNHWEREIDHLVYELYGLTEEEIRIVECK